MKQTFKIQGMTCDGCRKSVEEKLQAAFPKAKVEVSLQKHQLTMQTDQPLRAADLEKNLPDKYRVSTTARESYNNFETQTPSKLKQLRPLFLIFIYLVVGVVWKHYPRPLSPEAMLDFMGFFFLVFAFFKLLDLKGFHASFQMYDPLAKSLNLYGWIYPFLETLLGILFLSRMQTQLALWTTLVLLGITTFGVTKTLLEKKKIQCACLGTALKLPMTEATFIENAIMIAMAVAMLVGIV